MKHQPVEALFRPPVEYFSGLSYLAIGLLAAVAPSVLMMTPSVAVITASTLVSPLVCCGCIRAGASGVTRKACDVSNATGSLRSDLPVSHRKLFLGMGSAWDGRHTQRLADLQRNEGRKYKEQGRLYRWARRLRAGA